MTCLMAMGEGLVFRMAADPTLTLERAEPLMRAVLTSLFKPMTCGVDAPGLRTDARCGDPDMVRRGDCRQSGAVKSRSLPANFT